MTEPIPDDHGLRSALRDAYQAPVAPAGGVDAIVAVAARRDRRRSLLAVAAVLVAIAGLAAVLTRSGDERSVVVADETGVLAVHARLRDAGTSSEVFVALDDSVASGSFTIENVIRTDCDQIDPACGGQSQTVRGEFRILDGHFYTLFDHPELDTADSAEARVWLRRPFHTGDLIDLIGVPSVQDLLHPDTSESMASLDYTLDDQGRADTIELDHATLEVISYDARLQVEAPPSDQVVDDPNAASAYQPSPDCDRRRLAARVEPPDENAARAFMADCLDGTALSPEAVADQLTAAVLAGDSLEETMNVAPGAWSLDELIAQCGPVRDASSQVTYSRFLGVNDGNFEVTVTITTDSGYRSELSATISILTGRLSGYSGPTTSSTCS